MGIFFSGGISDELWYWCCKLRHGNYYCKQTMCKFVLYFLSKHRYQCIFMVYDPIYLRYVCINRQQTPYRMVGIYHYLSYAKCVVCMVTITRARSIYRYTYLGNHYLPSAIPTGRNGENIQWYHGPLSISNSFGMQIVQLLKMFRGKIACFLVTAISWIRPSI